MMNSDYDNFKTAIDDLASRYLRGLAGDELAAYFKQLARYPIELVVKATAAAPERYPTLFPSAGQLGEICEELAAQEQYAPDAVTLLRATAECEHWDTFEPEEEGGLYAGFLVCVHCGRAKPVVNQAAPDQGQSKPATEARCR